MPETFSEEELMRQANFVFKGTAQKLNAANVREVEATERTVVVRVDEIIQAPDSLADYTGQEITVELGGRKRMKQGEQAVFYTNGWIFGEGLAVRSLLQRPATRGIAALGASPGNPVENLANKQSRVRFEMADVVISGRVTGIRLPPDEVAAFTRGLMEAGAAQPAPVKRISEHDPLIQEAVVEIDEVHKGAHAARETAIRFPSSTDVKWYKAPKFRPGQQGFFMLHKSEARASGRTRGAEMVGADDAGDAFTALHPADFQPLDQPGGVRNVLAGQPDATTPDE